MYLFILLTSCLCLFSLPINYGEGLQKSLLFYDSQFSGPKPEWSSCDWCLDRNMYDGMDNNVDLVGGYHDCGDHVKFNLPGFYSITMLGWSGLEYRESYELIKEWEHLLHIVKHGLDYILKCHTEDNVLWAQVGDGSIDHIKWCPPEFCTDNRPSFQINATHPGSDLAGQASAALAVGYLLFKNNNLTYAELLLEHSKTLFNFGDTYRGKYSDSLPAAKGYYGSSGYVDELLWSALWLYRATGEQVFADYAHINSRVLVTWSLSWAVVWDSCDNGNMFLLCTMLNDQEACKQTENMLNRWAGNGKSNMGNIFKTPGGMAWLTGWGSLRYGASMSFLSLLYVDKRSSIDTQLRQDYINFAKSQIDYALGQNPLNTSYLVGFGNKWFLKWHHRGSHSSNSNSMVEPLNNKHLNYMLLGGPDKNDQINDTVDNFFQTEGGSDMQSSFVPAVAAMVKHFGGSRVDIIKQNPGREFYLNASFIATKHTVQLTTWVVSRTSWPPRAPEVRYRIFWDTGIPKTTFNIYYSQNASVSSVLAWSPAIDYVDIIFGKGSLFPGSDPASSKQVMVAWVSTSGDGLDMNSSWSFTEVSGVDQTVEHIPVYEKVLGDWILKWGKEPPKNGTKPLPPPTSPPIESFDDCKNLVWSQCDGLNFVGPRCCVSGTLCTYLSDYYSQCNPVEKQGGYWKCSPCVLGG